MKHVSFRKKLNAKATEAVGDQTKLEKIQQTVCSINRQIKYIAEYRDEFQVGQYFDMLFEKM